MKQYIGIILILVGVLILVLHATVKGGFGGNSSLWAGIAIECVGLLVHIILNKQRKF